MRTWPITIAVCILMAGCTSSEVRDAPNAPVDSAPAESAPTDAPRAGGDGPATDALPGQDAPLWARSGCQQLHGIFASPPGEWGLPEGWSTSGPDGAGATDTVFVYPTTCSGTEGVPGGTETWALLGVQPPSEHADPAVDLDYWVLSAMVDDPQLVDLLRGYGFPAQRGATTLTTSQGTQVWQAEGEDGASYTLAAAVGQAAGDDFVVVQRLWTLGPDGGPLAIRILIHHSTDGGIGATTFASQGDPQAPPLAPGLGHHIHSMEYEARLDRHTLDA